MTTQWSDLLLRALVELREVFSRLQQELDDTAREDFSRLFDGAGRLEQMLEQASGDIDSHDLRNVLAAIRGYAEILREDIGPRLPQMDDTLARLLKALHTAQDGDRSTGGSIDTRVIESEPGYILAVDDLQENRELVARNLSRVGHFVITAASGEEALVALQQSDVDVVLLDLMMPGMDGREVLRRIKEHPDWRATPVIVISGQQDMDGIIECIEAGADDYLFKPFNQVLLQARIKAGIERKRWHDREEQYRQQLERNEKFIRATTGGRPASGHHYDVGYSRLYHPQ
jgi:CheY-like chemotaxis protein